MTQNIVKIKLVGAEDDGGLVRFDDFTGFCRAVSRCLRRVDDVVRPEGERLRFRIVGMKFASASMSLEAIPPRTGRDDRAVVVSLFRETTSRLQSGRRPDTRFSFDDLEAFRDLVFPLNRHAKEVWVDGSRLTSDYVANIEGILGSAIPSIGQVTGRLERLNVHGRYEFVLFPVAGTRIVCAFDESILEQVRMGVKRSVTVSGILYFQPDKPLPDRVRVQGMEIHPPDGELPRLRDLKGIARRCTGNMTSVDFVRAIRDE
jgi:hypothetical protein